MAVVAHPDDVDFGCSGTLAGFIERGTHVTYCLLTSGDKGTHDPKMTPETLAETREKEQRAAGEAIGVKEFDDRVVELVKRDALGELLGFDRAFVSEAKAD